MTNSSAVKQDWGTAWAGHPGYASRLAASFAAEPEREVLHWHGRAITAGEFLRTILGTAAAMDEAGVTGTDVVAVLTEPNSPAMLAARYAAHLRGAAVCHLRSTNAGSTKPVMPLEDQAAILTESRAALLITDPTEVRRAFALRAAVGGTLTLAGFGVGEADLLPIRPADELVPPATPPWHPDATAAILFTSGSTGRPKGIITPYRAWEAVVRATMTRIQPDEGARLLVVTPLSHTVATTVDAVLERRGTALLREEFDAAQVLADIESLRVTRTFLGTSHLYRLLDHPGLPDADLSSLRLLIYGGSRAAPARLAEAARAFGPVLFQGYGTTETHRISVLLPSEHLDPALLGTVGRPFPAVSIRILDEAGAPVPGRGVGELCVRSDSLMDGYLGRPELTADTLRDGWFHTGDCGFLDEAGYLHLVGRLADVIKTRGIKVHPAELEHALAGAPGVAQAVVWGAEDADRVEHVWAAVVPAAGAALDPDALRGHVRAALTELHVPERIRILPSIPLTEAGKPDRAALAAQCR